MYAQLCKKLSEEAPNFEPQGSPCTFNIQLLKQCQEEFERRRRSKEFYEDGGQLSPEDEEQRIIFRHKMVGNLRFIGELGKLQIISKSVLYQCVEQLLEKSRRSSGDLAEDLECLCQIMRTSGRILDTEEAQPLMAQFFHRIQQLSVSPVLALRIRFMLQDIIDLRAAQWRPRKRAQQEGPRTITEVREEAARDLGVYMPPPPNSAPPASQYSIINPLVNGPTFFSQGGGARQGLDDVFGLPLGGCASLGTGPGVIPTQPDQFQNSQPFRSNRPQQQNQNTFAPKNYQPTNNYYQNKHFTNSFNRQQNNGYQQPNNQHNYNNKNDGAKDLPPRFKKMFSGGSQDSPHKGPPQRVGGDSPVSLRPSAMSLKPKTPGLLPQSAISTHNPSDKPSMHAPALSMQPNQKSPLFMPTNTLHKDPPLIINKAGDLKSSKPKKDKAMSRAEFLKRVRSAVQELCSPKPQTNGQQNHGNVDKVEMAFACLKSLKVPERHMADATHAIISVAVANSQHQDSAAHLLLRLSKAGLLSRDKLWNGLKQAVNEVDSQSTPRMAVVLSCVVCDSLVGLGEVADLCLPHHPLFLEVLSCIMAAKGRDYLQDAFTKSKVNLVSMVPAGDASKEQLSLTLEKKKLSFLMPLLRIQAELKAALEKDPSPVAFFKLIKDTVDACHHTEPAFVAALVTVVVSSITHHTTLAPDTDTAVNPDKGTAEKEKELLCKYKPVLQAFLHDHIDLQIVAIYALQVLTYTCAFPKGMLLRWFVYLYDLEIVEEEAFLAWKENVDDDYPGKGKALFQVNQWLTWLQTTEEDEDEEGADA